MKLRVPFVVSLPLLAALVCLVWRNQCRIAVLRTNLENLTAQAHACGLRVDPNNPGSIALTKGGLRPDRTDEAKRVAASAIAYGREFSNLRENFLRADPMVRQRVMEETERLMALDGAQLQTLISEVMVAEDLVNFQRAEIVVFALRRLASDHPQETLELITKSPEIWELAKTRDAYPDNVISTAAYAWAANDLPAALNWVRQHREHVPAILGVVLNAAEQDPQSARAIIGEFHMNLQMFPEYFAIVSKTPEQRVAMLKVLHGWRATADASAMGHGMDRVITGLVFGMYGRTEGFDSASRCIEAANLSVAEVEALTTDMKVKPGEEGSWVGWLAQKLPPEAARERIRGLMPQWHEVEPEAAAVFAKEHGIK